MLPNTRYANPQKLVVDLLTPAVKPIPVYAQMPPGKRTLPVVVAYVTSSRVATQLTNTYQFSVWVWHSNVMAAWDASETIRDHVISYPFNTGGARGVVRSRLVDGPEYAPEENTGTHRVFAQYLIDVKPLI